MCWCYCSEERSNCAGVIVVKRGECMLDERGGSEM